MMNEQTEKKIMNLLGIAQQANKLHSGDVAVRQAVRSGKAKLLLIAEDASEGAKKKYNDTAKFYDIELYYLFDKAKLGACIGKYSRAAVALSDDGLIQAMLKLIAADKEI